MMAETQSFLRGNSHRMMTYTRLHENPKGEARKVRLTIVAIGAVEGDSVDGEISVEVEEGAPRPTS
jgi:hypothetical protein